MVPVTAGALNVNPRLGIVADAVIVSWEPDCATVSVSVPVAAGTPSTLRLKGPM